MKVKEEGGKVGLKLKIQKTKIIASDPIISWEIVGETVETVSDFILRGAPVFLPRESQGQGSLVGYRLWGHTELATTEAT